MRTLRGLLFSVAFCLPLSVACSQNVRADNVGAAIGATVGLFVAGPVGLVIGAIVGEIEGHPWWFADPGTKCWIDTHWVRHCPKFPLN